MTKQEKLKKIIEYAVKRGWSFDDWLEKNWSMPHDWRKHPEVDAKEAEKEMIRLISKSYFVNILFNHDFAKAMFGEEEIELPNPDWCDDMPVSDDDLGHDTLPAYLYHLQQAVIQKDSIQYYYDYVKNQKNNPS